MQSCRLAVHPGTNAKVASRAEDSRNERPRRDLLQRSLRAPRERRRRSAATCTAYAIPRTLHRPYHLATIDTSVAPSWLQQERKQRRFHSPVRRAGHRNLTRSRICMEGGAERFGAPGRAGCSALALSDSSGTADVPAKRRPGRLMVAGPSSGEPPRPSAQLRGGGSRCLRLERPPHREADQRAWQSCEKDDEAGR
jgi:hypothetical protein